MEILVVDDYQEIGEYLCRILQDSGYAVVTATNGLEAIGKILQYPKIKIVITDIEMPQMNGISMTDILMIYRRDIKIIGMSGNPAYREYFVNKNLFFYSKPLTVFETNNLLKIVSGFMSEVGN